MLNESQIQQFHEDGFLTIHNFFDKPFVDQIVAAWNEVKEELQANTGRYQRSDRFVEGKPPEVLEKLYENQHLVHTVKDLLAEENIAVYLSNFLLKDKDWDGQVEPHQDMPYISGCQKKLITFVPLQPQNEENGGLKILKGTHKYGNIGIRGTIHPEQFSNMEIAYPSLEVGDVMFVNVLTWHYSEKSQIQRERPMLQIIYQPGTDGCYVGFEEPILVAGQWQTTHFLPYEMGITPDLKTMAIAHQQEVDQLKSQLQQAQSEVQRTHEEVKAFKDTLGSLKNRIDAMESSKFWKLRNRWLSLKQAVGLGASE